VQMPWEFIDVVEMNRNTYLRARIPALRFVLKSNKQTSNFRLPAPKTRGTRTVQPKPVPLGF
jgi:hypothetical protein